MPLITTDLSLAIQDLKQGKPVAIPTETVYGLAAMIDNPEAIKAVFAMKNRPLDHPLIVHVAQDWDLTQWVEEIPEYAHQLMSAFWPGALTLVFRSNAEKVSPLVTGGQSSVAIRCPSHPVAQELLIQLDTPLVAPSANPFGKISPTTALHVNESFSDKTLTILDGGRCAIGIESTIVDATNPQGYRILRHGLINEKAIAAVISTQCLNEKSNLRAPGVLDTHYQPRKKLYYFDDHELLARFCHQHAGEVYVISSIKPQALTDSLFHFFALQPEQAAFDLYYQLRKADESRAVCIIIELPRDTSEWQGVRERILKAGSQLDL